MDTTLIVTVIGFALIAALLIYGISTIQRRQREDQTSTLLQQQIDGLREQVRLSLEGSSNAVNMQMGQLNSNLSTQLNQVLSQVNLRLKESSELIQKTNQGLGERMDGVTRVFGDVKGSLGKLDEASQRIFEVGRDISGLKQILQAPKVRGGLGELFLENLLSQMLPTEHYVLQHQFKSGIKVDAAIRLGGSLIPVDAKFPLPAFQKILDAQDDAGRKAARSLFTKDVRKRIDEVSKYILPDEGTFDFALMYIPAENVYYEVITREGDESIADYALARKVIPVSPNTMYAYLQAIVLGLRGMKIEENAKEIRDSLGRLKGDLGRFKEHFDTLGKHLNNSKGKYDEASSVLAKFEAKLEGIESGAEG
ncbi:MAG: DNA recombination protein RmuC [Deltaproteobacteria bacterium]|nr:DNA recombination protein RmuC [Deltaproteobacteria bacterium]